MPASVATRVQKAERLIAVQAPEIPALPGDPLALAATCGFQPDPWQAAFLTSAAQQVILACSRQSGKSTSSALLALWEALVRDRSLILLLSPSLRQSGELFRKVRDLLSRYDPPGRLVAAESALRLELVNHSRIISLPGAEQTVRGFSGPRLLLVDEAAFVPDALYQAIRPMLAVSRGRIVLLSSPFGQRGFFYHEWTEGGPEWLKVRVTAYDCPRIPRDWLEAERRSLPPAVFASEYMAEFTELASGVFTHDAVMGALSDDVAPLFPLPGVGAAWEAAG